MNTTLQFPREKKLTKNFFKTTTPPLPLYLELKCDDAGGLTAGPQDVLVSGQVVRLGDLSGFVEEVRTRVQDLDIVLPLNTELSAGVVPQHTDIRGQALGKQILPLQFRLFQSFQNPLPRIFGFGLLVFVAKVICGYRESWNQTIF